MRGVLLALALVVGLTATLPVKAWSAFGHRLVGLLAQDQLSPETRKKVDALLAQEPNADMGTVAAWADEIRGDARYRFTGPYHYVNFRDGSCKYKPKRDCARGACIVAAIDKYRKILGSPKHSDADRLEALKFLIHFVGDVHQPLHAGNRNDRGGNQFQVNINGKGANLHGVWDYHVLNSSGLSLSHYRAQLGPKVATTAVDSMNPSVWAGDACRVLDMAKVYPASAGKLPKNYLDTQRSYAESQIVLAASRLAKLLENELGRL